MLDANSQISYLNFFLFLSPFLSQIQTPEEAAVLQEAPD